MIRSIFRFLWPVLLLIGAGFLLYWVWGHRLTDNSLPTPIRQESTVKDISTPTLTVNGKTFNIEVADTYKTRKQGLMYRTSLAENNGMFFVFPQSKAYDFWMPNVSFPLDIVWISEDFKVVDIKTVPPCEEVETKNCPFYTPDGKAKYVLEVNANAFPGIIGDEVNVSF